ncbi:MAG: InlB B-repeat-containing protein, partial [Bacillota bacterium]
MKSCKLILIIVIAVFLILSMTACIDDDDAPTFNVIYSDNESSSGTTPEDDNDYEAGDTVTVLDNTGGLERTGYIFDGWNTQEDGNGTDYAAGDTFDMPSQNVILYAKWTNDDTSIRHAQLVQVSLKPKEVMSP